MSILIASTGGEILTLLLLPFWALLAGYFGGYAAHSLLVILEQTAAGFDRVCWPDEGFLDWFWKVGYLFALVVLLLVPAGLLATWPPMGSAAAWFVFGLVAWLSLWLLLPVVLLSSLSGSSRLFVVRWTILQRLAVCRRPLLVFYALAAAIIAPCVAGIYFVALGWQEVRTAALGTAPWIVGLIEVVSIVVAPPVTGLLAATALMLYARLLGRLAWMMEISTAAKEAEEEREAIAQAETPPAEVALAAASSTSTPQGPSKGPATYALAEEPPSAPLPEEIPFRWQPGRIPPPAPPKSQWRDREDLRPAGPDERDDKPEPAEQARWAALLEPKVLLFPWYRTSLRAWLWLAFGATCLALLLRLQMAYF
jgi:hypothetical protein